MQKFFKSELGRSMLEMLGVLAIIGVLSVAAIAGYSYAITKWKANETIADLHTRALEYTRQLAIAKKIAPDFQFKNFDLGNENALGNPVTGYPLLDDPNFFEIEVRGIPTDVCQQIIRDVELPILDVAVNMGNYGATENQCAVETLGNRLTMTFLFSKTLEDAGAPVTPAPEVTVPRPDDCPSHRWATVAGVCCPANEYGGTGQCCPSNDKGWGRNVQRCCTADEDMVRGYNTAWQWTYFCCPKGHRWDHHVQRCSSAENKCTSNEDCLANEYCDYVYNHCTPPTSGFCKTASVSQTKVINGVTYKRSEKAMSFWSIENFCIRLGGRAVRLSDFGCGYDFAGNQDSEGFCNQEATDAEEDARSDTMKLFMSGLGVGAVWTTDEYGDCNIYDVTLNSGKITNLFKGYDRNTLCRIDK